MVEAEAAVSVKNYSEYVTVVLAQTLTRLPRTLHFGLAAALLLPLSSPCCPLASLLNPACHHSATPLPHARVNEETYAVISLSDAASKTRAFLIAFTSAS